MPPLPPNVIWAAGYPPAGVVPHAGCRLPANRAAATVGSWTPETRRTAILQAALLAEPRARPGQRQHLIDQYRAWGIHPTEEELTGPL